MPVCRLTVLTVQPAASSYAQEGTRKTSRSQRATPDTHYKVTSRKCKLHQPIHQGAPADQTGRRYEGVLGHKGPTLEEVLLTCLFLIFEFKVVHEKAEGNPRAVRGKHPCLPVEAGEHKGEQQEDQGSQQACSPQGLMGQGV